MENKKRGLYLFLACLSLLALSCAPQKPLLLKEQRSNAREFTLASLEGDSVNLSSLKGKVVYLELWASWCGYCKLEMPSSADLRERYKGRDDIAFLYISSDEKIEKWKWAVKNHKISGKAVYNLHATRENQPGFMEFYGTGYVPHFILIDKNGKIANQDAPFPSDRKIEEQIDLLLAE